MNQRGITLTEIIISVAIITLISTIIVMNIGGFRERQIFDTEVRKVVTLLQEARNRTLAGRDAFQYSVHFDTNQAVLFRGSSYSSSDTLNEFLTLNPILQFSNISLNGGGSNVVFQKLTGKTNQFGSTTISFITSASTSETIIINASGLIELD